MDWLFYQVHVLEGVFASPQNFFICLLSALACGILVALSATFRAGASRSFTTALVLLPMIVYTVIVMVNGSVGTGVAVMGAFSLVRFRSVAGKARDIASIFLVMTAGLACAAGYVVLAPVFTLLVCLVGMAVSLIPMGKNTVDLHVTVPESLHYVHEFDDLFEEYTVSHRLTKVKTTNMGSLYKLTYRIKLKNAELSREFIDKLRVRNGNLEIALMEIEGNDEL